MWLELFFSNNMTHAPSLVKDGTHDEAEYHRALYKAFSVLPEVASTTEIALIFQAIFFDFHDGNCRPKTKDDICIALLQETSLAQKINAYPKYVSARHDAQIRCICKLSTSSPITSAAGAHAFVKRTTGSVNSPTRVTEIQPFEFGG